MGHYAALDRHHQKEKDQRKQRKLWENEVEREASMQLSVRSTLDPAASFRLALPQLPKGLGTRYEQAELVSLSVRGRSG